MTNQVTKEDVLFCINKTISFINDMSEEEFNSFYEERGRICCSYMPIHWKYIPFSEGGDARIVKRLEFRIS